MEAKLAELLTETLQGEVYEDYSGRGMYGEKTTGVTFPSMDAFYEECAEIIREGDEDDRALLADLFDNLRTDNLGHDIIIY